eukprot:Sspe_Gene.99298::Locus_72780_Transcript_1_1_Confidence_1.000_Length_517::g.99298::m.99298
MAVVRNQRSFKEVLSSESFTSWIPLIAENLDRACIENPCHADQATPTVFDGSKPRHGVQLSVNDYLVRIVRNAHCSPQVFVVMAILMERYLDKKRIAVSYINVHRLILTCFVVAAKLRDDVLYWGSGSPSLKKLSLPFPPPPPPPPP